jgi:hypothetical protein
MRGCAAGGGNEPKFGTDGPGQTVSRGSVFSVKRFSDPDSATARELQNLIERAVILSHGPVLQVPLQDLDNRTAGISTGTTAG